MNHKQKICYTILGAGIMLIGMLINNLTSSPVTAQNHGELTCQKLTFVNETGEPHFTLKVESNGLSIRNKEGEKALTLNSHSSKHVLSLYNKKDVGVVSLYAWKSGGGNIIVRDGEGKEVAAIVINQRGGAVSIKGKKGGGYVRVSDKAGVKAASMSTTEHGGRVDVFNKQGENRAVMSVNEYGNGAVSTWDKNGYRQ